MPRIRPKSFLTEENSKRKGEGKPSTFGFLGFTHYCGKSQAGKFRVKRKSRQKKVQASLKKCKEWLKVNRTKDIHYIMDRLKRSLIGYYNYYCVTDNSPTVGNYFDKVRRLMFKWMNRRSQKKSFNWDKYVLFLKKFPLPRPTVKVSIYDLKDDLNYIL